MVSGTGHRRGDVRRINLAGIEETPGWQVDQRLQVRGSVGRQAPAGC